MLSAGFQTKVHTSALHTSAVGSSLVLALLFCQLWIQGQLPKSLPPMGHHWGWKKQTIPSFKKKEKENCWDIKKLNKLHSRETSQSHQHILVHGESPRRKQRICPNLSGCDGGFCIQHGILQDEGLMERHPRDWLALGSGLQVITVIRRPCVLQAQDPFVCSGAAQTV